MPTPLRLLLLEDNPDDAEMLVRALRQAGLVFDWERVQTEPEFLAALAPPPDLILADISLPGFSGLRALQLAQALTVDVPVILVSGVTGDELAVSAIQQGAADYLLKDRLGRLGLAVSNALRRSQLTAQKLAAEAALHLSEARNRIVADLTADFAMELRLNAAGRLEVDWLTASFTDLTGYTLDDVQTQGWRMLLHPADLALAEQFVGGLYAGRNGSEEVRFVTRAGAVLWLRIYAQAVNAASVPRFYLAGQDITERKQGEAALRQQAEEFAALYETARDVSLAHDLPALLETLVGRAVTLLRVPVAGVYLFEPDRGDLELTVSHGLSLPSGTRLRLGEGLAGHVAHTREKLNVPDYTAWPGRSAQYQQIPFAAVLGVPMFYQGELVGVVVVDELLPSPRRFTESDERLLTLFAGLAAGAVRTSRLLAAQRQRLLEQQAINRLSTALRAGQSLDEMLPRLLDETLAVVNAADGAVGLVVDGEAQLRVQRGFFANLAGIGQRRPDRGIGEEVVATGRAYVSRDFATDPLTRPSVRSQLAPGWGGVVVPIHSGAGVTGVLYVAVPLPREILPSELRLLTTVAEMAGSALQRMQVLEQAQERAEQLAAVNALSQALAETLDLPHLYTQLGAATRRLLPVVSTLALYLLDPAQRHLVCAYAERAGQALAVGDRPPLALDQLDAALAQVVRDRRPHIETDRAAPAVMAVPLLAKGEVIGLVVAESERAGPFAAAEADLLAGVANTAAVAIDNARLFAETEQRLQYFEALHHIDMAISGSLDLNVTLMVLLDQLRSKLRVDAAAVLLYHPAQRAFEFTVGRGFRTRQIEQGRLRLGEGPTGQAVLERRALRLGQLSAAPSPRPRPEVIEPEGFQAYFALPLLAKGQVQGLLELFHRAPLAPDAEWLNFLDALASQAAIAVDNATLFERLQRSNVELMQAYDATIEGWAYLLDRRDQRALDHTRRLAARTVELARALGVPDEQLGHLRRGALLHDVGLLALPDTLVNRPGPLEPAEWAEQCRHPQLAQELLTGIAFLRPALDIPYAHHERWDGSGYPRRLAGEVIPRAARIFAVVDVWDALTSPRPWRAAWTVEAATAHLRAKSGVEFDPEVVSAFLKLPPAPTD